MSTVNTEHALLRQSFFGLSRFTIIVAAFSISFTSQRYDLIVAIANQLLWFYFWNDGAMFTRVVLINVRITVKKSFLTLTIDILVQKFTHRSMMRFFSSFSSTLTAGCLFMLRVVLWKL